MTTRVGLLTPQYKDKVLSGYGSRLEPGHDRHIAKDGVGGNHRVLGRDYYHQCFDGETP